LVLHLINRVRHGDKLGGWLDKFGVAGAVFYGGSLALVAKYTAIKAHGQVGAVVVLALVLPLTAIALKDPIEYLRRRHDGQQETLGAVLMRSVVGALETLITFLANTVSFMRLAAYAMSHAALLTATFLIATEVRHSAGSLAVAVIGNLVAILLEGIIAAVQSLRLEYYEFFSKFLPGTGLPFKPFRLPALETGAILATSRSSNTGKSLG